ncbi:SCO family protein [Tenacibaculum ovolyticum]|uniref:SCO family protein n=1 Tax=Tenacibaculum ovolyticum TaxID=104270 RepID=UPI0022F3C7C5|nr:SCO family protein [Tenacibaculum ovolyticum]WBX75058.1 SCO family protein [Tenacibaculum ovolyticum]
MKKNKTILVVLLLFITFASCKNSTIASITNKEITYQCPMKCEGEKIFTDKGSCSVCKMDLKLVANLSKKIVSNEISDESIFNLTSKWNTEEGNSIVLKDLRGKTLVMVMIYTTCKAACPRLVADMRNIEKQIPKKYNNDLRYVLVSIDPETDTSEKLKVFAKENLMDDEHWMFLQGTKTSVREFANVLAVKYKEISPLDFSHSNIISVFNPEGELVHQQEGLGVDNKETILKIKETVTK